MGLTQPLVKNDLNTSHQVIQVMKYVRRMSNLDFMHSGCIALHDMGYDNPIEYFASGNADLFGKIVRDELFDQRTGKLQDLWLKMICELFRGSQLAEPGHIAIVISRQAAVRAWWKVIDSKWLHETNQEDTETGELPAAS